MLRQVSCSLSFAEEHEVTWAKGGVGGALTKCIFAQPTEGETGRDYTHGPTATRATPTTFSLLAGYPRCR